MSNREGRSRTKRGKTPVSEERGNGAMTGNPTIQKSSASK